ncbi:hypothetical protein [Deinococcus planocerae]|uniref:hypothetical protein n=1 Tax=Deinococcus planocerae TaxID=1737569 RepID=UPI001FE56D3A|nr:hypothetical protein [Deinococcus planocerae]
MVAPRLLLQPLLALAVTVTGTLALAGTASLPAPGTWAAKLGALLPQPGQAVQLMEQRPRLTLVELQQRVTRVGGSPDALRAVMMSAAKGQKPTYDERLGLTREEFERYLVFQPVLATTGKVLKLPLTREGNRLRFGDAPGLGGVLRGLVLDLTTGELRTPEGFATKPRAILANTAPDRILDIRGGYEWVVKGNSPVTQNGVNGQLQLLQLTGGQVIFSYYRLSMLHGTIQEGGVVFGYTR